MTQPAVVGVVEIMPGVGVEILRSIPDDQPDSDELAVELTAGRLVGIDPDDDG